MTDNIMRHQFETWVECARPPLQDHPELVIPALMTTAAFTHPVDQIAIFTAIDDALAHSHDRQEQVDHIAAQLPWAVDGKERIALPRILWDEFWAIIERPQDEFTTELDLTLAVVALGVHYDPRMVDACEQALLQFDSVKKLIAQPEIRLKTDDLRNHATDSLATDLLNMLTSNGYDIEVIDADTVVIGSEYPAQNRTNRRILQLHDIWHLVGGYGFTGAGEIAISGFQLAQFGQNYSTRFLATVATKAAFNALEFLPMMLAVTFDGWRHGRNAQPLIDAPWHKLIADPISKIRADYGLRPLDSPAVQMMETLAASMAEGK